MRGFGLMIMTGLAMGIASPGHAQQGSFTPSMGEVSQSLPFVTLDDARLFASTAYGKRLLDQLDAARLALAAENRQIEGQLSERERDLTARRPSMNPQEFRTLADTFNDDVKRHRQVQLGKEQDLFRKHEEDRQQFRLVANRVLTELMAERGALALISEEAILLGFKDIDITDEAIKRMDEVYGDGAKLTFEDLGAEGAPPDTTPATP